MNTSLSQSIQNPFDNTVFQNISGWARYAVVVRTANDDHECSATMHLLYDTTPLSFQRFWRLHCFLHEPSTVTHDMYLFTWMGPQRLISIIRLSDSHRIIDKIVRVDNNDLWHRIGEHVDHKHRNQTEIERLWRDYPDTMVNHPADAIERANRSLEKQIQKLYAELIA